MYQDIESVLKVNGGLSAPFKVKGGIRKGCALSGMLYALSIELMLYKIWSCIEDLIYPDCSKNYVLWAFADDVVGGEMKYWKKLSIILEKYLLQK